MTLKCREISNWNRMRTGGLFQTRLTFSFPPIIPSVNFPIPPKRQESIFSIPAKDQPSYRSSFSMLGDVVYEITPPRKMKEVKVRWGNDSDRRMDNRRVQGACKQFASVNCKEGFEDVWRESARGEDVFPVNRYWYFLWESIRISHQKKEKGGEHSAYCFIRFLIVIIDPMCGILLPLILNLIKLGEFISLSVIKATLSFNVFVRFRSNRFIWTPSSSFQFCSNPVQIKAKC